MNSLFFCKITFVYSRNTAIKTCTRTHKQTHLFSKL